MYDRDEIKTVIIEQIQFTMYDTINSNNHEEIWRALNDYKIRLLEAFGIFDE